jgi:hypothetical protein
MTKAALIAKLLVMEKTVIDLQDQLKEREAMLSMAHTAQEDYKKRSLIWKNRSDAFLAAHKAVLDVFVGNKF